MRLRALFCAFLLAFGCATTPAQSLEVEPSDPTAQVAQDERFPEYMIDIGDVNAQNMGAAWNNFIGRVAEGDKKVLFRINSFGGSVFLGLKFMQAVEDVKKLEGVTVQCVVDTHAMSMGFVYLQGMCDERYMTKRAILLAHNASGSVQGTAEDMRESAEFLEAINEAMAEVCAERLNMTLDAYKAKIAHGDWTFTWQEALEVGAVDGVVSHRALPPLWIE